MIKKRVSLYIILVALLLLVWGSVAFSVYISSNHTAVAEGRSPAIKIAWKTLASNAKSLGISSSGRYAYVTTMDGKAHIYHVSDSTCRVIKLPAGANKIVVSPDGKYILAYAYLNPSLSKLTFLNDAGDEIWSKEVSGAIWCADACSSDRNAKFIVGTGENYIYALDIGKTRRRYKRWRTPGAVTSLYVDPKGEFVTAGTWQSSAIIRYSISGRHLWEVDADSGSLQYLETLRDNSRVVVSSVPNRADVDGIFMVLDGKGNRQWQGQIDSSTKAKICSSPNGRWVCMSYEKRITHKGSSMREKHSMLYDSSGRMLWDKGSSFFQSEPILVTSSGYTLLCHEDNALFMIAPQGELIPSIKLPASIDQSIASRDGSHALLHCSDNRIYLLSVGH